MGILDWLRGRSGEDGYVDVDLERFEEFEEAPIRPPEAIVRLAELNNSKVLSEIKQEIMKNNIVLVDISPIRQNKSSLEGSLEELKSIAEDTGGDIAGVADELILVVPKGMRIDRNIVLGGED